MDQSSFVTKVIRSRRRSFALQVNDKAELIVRAPLRASVREVQDLVAGHSRWISRKRALALERIRQRPRRCFETGEEMLFLGRSWPLTLTAETGRGLAFDNGFQLAASSRPQARALFRDFFAKAVLEIVAESLRRCGELSGLECAGIRISNARRRWGSCAPSGVLRFSWRLAMAPREVIDYVVAHELAHLRRRDHSARFWEVVAAMVPDFRRSRKWLRENGHLLDPGGD